MPPLACCGNAISPFFWKNTLIRKSGWMPSVWIAFTRQDFMKVADQLHQAGLQITLHGPFQDILPGALDARILAASRARLQDAFDLLEIFQPRSIVCHIGYEARHYQGLEERWLAHSVATWEPLAAQAAQLWLFISIWKMSMRPNRN